MSMGIDGDTLMSLVCKCGIFIENEEYRATRRFLTPYSTHKKSGSMVLMFCEKCEKLRCNDAPALRKALTEGDVETRMRLKWLATKYRNTPQTTYEIRNLKTTYEIRNVQRGG